MKLFESFPERVIETKQYLVFLFLEGESGRGEAKATLWNVRFPFTLIYPSLEVF